MSTERREHVRQRVSRVEVKVASQESFRASYLRDLSLGGLFVRSRQPLAEGTAVVVELAVETRPPVRLRGQVMRQEHSDDGTPRGFGVRFSTVDEETKETLARIISEHEPQAATAEPEDLATALAEARGSLEAYEQTLALLRESEGAMAQRLELSETERGVLASLALELQGRVQALEGEKAALRANLTRLMERQTSGDAQQELVTRLTNELKAARGAVAHTAHEHEATMSQLESELAAQNARTEAQRAEFEAEVTALKAQLESKDDAPLRAELQDFAAQLDDERLKSMALERALHRFVEMGGVIPPRKD